MKIREIKAKERKRNIFKFLQVLFVFLALLKVIYKGYVGSKQLYNHMCLLLNVNHPLINLCLNKSGLYLLILSG
jgi:hypothetical protein